MPVKHGRALYQAGCRCDECTAAQRRYQRKYRERRANGQTPVSVAPVLQVQPTERGPVEAAVESELTGLASAAARPALVAVAAAMARILDGRVPTPKPAAAKVLVSVMDTLHKGSAQGRRGSLAVVRTMTEKDGA